MGNPPVDDLGLKMEQKVKPEEEIPKLLDFLSASNFDSTYVPKFRDPEVAAALRRRFNIPDENDRLKKILDALAALVVEDAGERVYALTMSRTKDQITLHVASNGDVPLSVTCQMYGIWRKLKEYSVAFWKEKADFKRRRRRGLNTDDADDEASSEQSDAITEIQHGLVQRMIGHHCSKIRDGFRKRNWEGEYVYKDIAAKCLQSLDGAKSMREEWKNLADWVECVGDFLVKPGELSTDHIDAIWKLLMGARHCCNKLITNKKVGGVAERSVLQQLDKLLKAPGLVNTLLNAATNRKLANWFLRCSLKVVPLEPLLAPPQADRPLYSVDNDNILSMFQNSDHYDQHIAEENFPLQSSAINVQKSKYIPAELTLLHFWTSRVDRPYAYVAASKRVCACSAIYVDKLNSFYSESEGMTWEVRPPGKKFTDSWGVPPRPASLPREEYERIVAKTHEELRRQASTVLEVLHYESDMGLTQIDGDGL